MAEELVPEFLLGFLFRRRRLAENPLQWLLFRAVDKTPAESSIHDWIQGVPTFITRTVCLLLQHIIPRFLVAEVLLLGPVRHLSFLTQWRRVCPLKTWVASLVPQHEAFVRA